MKKRNISLLLIISILLVYKNTYAFDSNNYKNRSVCEKYELAGFHTNGDIVNIGCYNSYEEAKNAMKANGADDLAIMTKVSGKTKIIDANVALLDLSVNPETLTYFYTNSELTGSAYTYMDTGSLYGGVDGAHIETGYSNTYGVWTAKVKIGNFTGWIKQSTYEIVPLNWIKSSSSYTVTNNDIKHNYVSKIQNNYNGSNGRYIGPKPEMLSPGTYYSYDGHYFYTNLKTLIKDYKNNNYNNAVNKNNAYYNYYMYLSNHTKTTYSSININEYIRNNLGYKENTYGNAASSGTSRLYGSGTFFYYAQEKYGVNAILSLSLSRNETGNGTSFLAVNKNNGFGLNAVDSNPINGANWYASFSSSILGYASKWITYGYAHPRDWRYFGPQFGDKWIGMNVKYASDTYWSEKMAANYYSFDKAFGLQDYNYYQLGVVKGPTNTYKDPSTSSKTIYTYPEKEDAVVIVEEITKNNEKWYKIVSDLNIDNNYNEITSGDYNWNHYVYVKANDIVKINKGKNGPISPENVFEYQDSNYEYDLYIENTELKPKVAITTKNAPYYYDSSLLSQTGKVVLKDRYVMVYTAAYNNGVPVAYLITSDYFHDQKEWVSADSIKLINKNYGKVTVSVSGNQYTWVNYNTEDAKYSLISGLYTNTYVPVLESQVVGNNTWYKVPVSLTENNNVYGYTLAKAPGVSITTSATIIENRKPTITAKNQELYVGETFDSKKDVSAYDNEDGDITNRIEVIENKVDTSKAGEYQVTYHIKDSNNQETTATIMVLVKENNAPVINASNKTINEGETFNPTKDVTASDKEDGNLTNKIVIKENTLNENKAGTYKIVYEVTDSMKKTTTKEIKVTVLAQKKEEPVKEEEKQADASLEDIDLEQLMDSLEEGEFYLENLTWDKKKKVFNISGYCIIKNQDNTSDKEYAIILVDKNTEEVHAIEIDSWKDNTPYDLGTENGNSYTNSWFKGNIDFTNIPNGDYDLYMLAATDEFFTLQLIDNFFNQDIDKRGEDNSHGYNFKVLEELKTQQIELSIRDELYTTSESPTFRNMTNEFENIKFQNNKLYIQGYSYNYNGTYANALGITRKMIIEDTSTFKQTIIDLGSCKGPYELKTKDKLDKTYAWYEKEIDISKLEKGTYSIWIYTKTTNAEDYGELVDMFRELKESIEMNNKTYTITFNSNRLDRIELIIK